MSILVSLDKDKIPAEYNSYLNELSAENFLQTFLRETQGHNDVLAEYYFVLGTDLMIKQEFLQAKRYF